MVRRCCHGTVVCTKGSHIGGSWDVSPPQCAVSTTLQPHAVWKCSCYSCPSPSSVIPNTCIVGVGLTSLSIGTPHLTVLISIPIPVPISIPYPIPIPIPGTRCLRDLCRSGTTGNASHVPMTRGALPGSVHKHCGTVPTAHNMSARNERHARRYLPAHCAQEARGHRGSRRDLGPGDGDGHRHGASAHRAGRVRQPCGSAGLATHGVLTRVRSYGTGMREAQGAHEGGAVRARYAGDWHCSGWAVPTCCWFTSRPRDVAPGRKLQPLSCLGGGTTIVDKTETRWREDGEKTETRWRQDGDKTETRRRQDGDKTETRWKQDGNKTDNSWE